MAGSRADYDDKVGASVDAASWKARLDERLVPLGWKNASGGFRYRTTDEYVYFAIALPPRTASPKATLHAKPLALDPIFWEILGLTENAKRGPSFRVTGAFTVPAPEVARVTADLSEPLLDAPTVDRLCAELHATFLQSSGELRSLADFEAALDDAPRLVTTAIVWLIASGRRDEAALRLEAELAKGAQGGFWSDGSFNERALAYLMAG